MIRDLALLAAVCGLGLDEDPIAAAFMFGIGAVVIGGREVARVAGK